jgi:hypothetical protein
MSSGRPDLHKRLQDIVMNEFIRMDFMLVTITTKRVERSHRRPLRLERFFSKAVNREPTLP